MSGTTSRILIVEDDPVAAAAIAMQLEAADFVVDGPYASVADGAAALAQDFPDAAIIDVRLRGQDSFLLADDLELYGIPFVLCSHSRPGERFGKRPVLSTDSIEAQLLPALDALLH